jgi:ribonuclease HI
VLNRELWEALDRARLPGVPFSYVKGHSGDPDNDRCDAIAVAFAKGGRPALAQAIPQAGPVPALSPSPVGAEPVLEPAPLALGQLLSRLELADRLAAGGYSLSLVELAQLVQVPMRQLAEKATAWTWRDWRVLPDADGRWRLERDAAGSEPMIPGT